MGAFVTDIVLSQNYFESIFTRFPKKLTDDVVDYLKAQGLPHKVMGNAGQGGPDRRGGDDGRARPASVKVRRARCLVHSLLLAMRLLGLPQRRYHLACPTLWCQCT